MFTTAKGMARRVARILTKAASPRVARRVARTQLGRDAFLEARDCPAYWWLGGLSNNSAGVAANWTTVASPSGPRSATLPGTNDTIEFNGGVSSQPCFYLGSGTSSYYSIGLVNGYAGAVHVYNALSYHAFVLAAPGVYNAYQDQTVDQDFDWTQGTLGGNGTTMHLTGGTADVTPGTNGLLQTGMGLSFEGTVAGTISSGTVKFLGTRCVTVTGSSAVSATNVAFTSLSAAGDPVTLPAGQTQTFKADHVDSARGLLVKGGKAVIEGGGSVKFAGIVNQNLTASIQLEGGALVIENGTTLDAGTSFRTGPNQFVQNNVSVIGGRLATRAKANVQAQPDATVDAIVLYVTGDTTEVKISDVAENPAGVTGHQYARLVSTHNIEWSGGTYRPSCQPGDLTKADVWFATDQFSVNNTQLNNGTAAKVAPEAGGAGNFGPNSDYLVIRAGVSIGGTGPLPQSTVAGWDWAPGTARSTYGANPVIVTQWKIRKA